MCYLIVTWTFSWLYPMAACNFLLWKAVLFLMLKRSWVASSYMILVLALGFSHQQLSTNVEGFWILFSILTLDLQNNIDKRTETLYNHIGISHQICAQVIVAVGQNKLVFSLSARNYAYLECGRLDMEWLRRK